MDKRFRGYGFAVGKLKPAPQNSITDVPGVSVGHATLHADTGYTNGVCTGVTSIFPHQGNLFRDKPSAAAYVINGYGKTTGLVQVEELGEIEAPIMLTNTFSVPAVTEGALQYMLEQNPEIGDTGGSLNVVVGECNDSYLNDMRGMHVRPAHALQAIQTALSEGDGPVLEGSVGAGTGMRCFGWSGGIGTASRKIESHRGSFVLGTLLLTNFGDSPDLTVLCVPVGQYLQPDDSEENKDFNQQGSPNGDLGTRNRDGSVIVVIATNAPLNSRQLKRLAKRATFGLARTGSIAHHGSGDIVIAFSVPTTGNTQASDAAQRTNGVSQSEVSEPDLISEFFRAVVESTEESVLNSLAANRTMTGRNGRILTALPMQRVANLLNSHYPHFR